MAGFRRYVVGVVGLGHMGAAFAPNLLEARDAGLASSLDAGGPTTRAG